MQSNLVDLKIATPDGDEVTAAMGALTYAEAFTVETSSDSLKGQEARNRLSTKIKALNDARMKLTRPIDAAKQTIMQFFAGPVATLERAKGILDSKLIQYERDQEAIRREAQRREEVAAAKERARLQAIADEATRKANEEARIKREAAEKAEAEGKAAEAAKLRAAAVRTEETAAAKAQVFEERAASTVAPIIQADTAKATGTSFRKTWGWKVKDKSKVKPQFWLLDEVAIGKVVRSMGPAAAELIGGIEVAEEMGIASRRGAA